MIPDRGMFFFTRGVGSQTAPLSAQGEMLYVSLAISSDGATFQAPWKDTAHSRSQRREKIEDQIRSQRHLTGDELLNRLRNAQSELSRSKK